MKIHVPPATLGRTYRLEGNIMSDHNNSHDGEYTPS